MGIEGVRSKLLISGRVQYISRVVLPEPYQKVLMMRVSEAALAVMTRRGQTGETEYLTQWNDRWQAYALIGGHREADESFRECCIREVEEELGLLRDVDFRVAPQPQTPVREFTAFSKSAGVDTKYIFQFFETILLNARAAMIIGKDLGNRWLSRNEIQQRQAADMRAVADQVALVLDAE